MPSASQIMCEYDVMYDGQVVLTIATLDLLDLNLKASGAAADYSGLQLSEKHFGMASVSRSDSEGA